MSEIEEDYVATKFTSNRFNIPNKTIIESNGINFECEIRFDESANDASTWSTPFVCIIIITIIDNNEWSTEPRAPHYYYCYVYANRVQSTCCRLTLCRNTQTTELTKTQRQCAIEKSAVFLAIENIYLFTHYMAVACVRGGFCCMVNSPANAYNRILYCRHELRKREFRGYCVHWFSSTRRHEKSRANDRTA